MPSAPPWRVAVVVPARDEAAVLGGCLAAVARAASRVRPAPVHVIVVADRCRDGTVAVAAEALAGTDAAVVRSDAGNVGVARGVGVATARRLVPHGDARHLWIATTDADSRVPPDWLRSHITAAAAGWRAVVGGIDVDDWGPRDRHLGAGLVRHRQRQAAAGSRPVHGANLGVAAAALDAVGGVPPQVLSEDAALVRVLEAAGIPVLWAPRLVVRTSARRSPRVPGGFSSLLDRLEVQT